jgi:transposase
MKSRLDGVSYPTKHATFRLGDTVRNTSGPFVSFTGQIEGINQVAIEVSADKAYLGAENLLTTLRNGAIPYIPFKSNSVPHSRGSYGPKSELWTRMYHFYSLHRAEFLQHYHKRSNVETMFHMIKSKFGQRLRSRTLTAQVNEPLCKVLCHNLCVVIQPVHELGIETNFEAANC